MTLGAIRHIVRPPDRRPVEVIDRDLDDEIAFHLARAEADLVAAGTPAGDAPGKALARFGDIERIKSRCRRIALEERIMLKRIHLAVTIVLGVLVLALFVGILLSVRAQAVHIEVAQAERAHAEAARQQALQMNEFLTTMLETSDGERVQKDLAMLLDKAVLKARELEDEEVAARVLDSIARARERLEDAIPSGE